jgi:hypothetical protein
MYWAVRIPRFRVSWEIVWTSFRWMTKTMMPTRQMSRTVTQNRMRV